MNANSFFPGRSGRLRSTDVHFGRIMGRDYKIWEGEVNELVADLGEGTGDSGMLLYDLSEYSDTDCMSKLCQIEIGPF